MYKKIYLKPGKEAGIKRFHPWIFSGAIDRTDKDVDEGDLVEVVDHDGKVLGVGHFQFSTISVRLLTFKNEAVDREFWTERLAQALQVRRSLGLMRHDNEAFRLVHGEGDGLPGLIVDIYRYTAVVQAHSVGMHRARHDIAHALMQLMPQELENVYYKSDKTLPFMEEIGAESGYLFGGNADSVAKEYGLQFQIDWVKGQKTGFFIDQRENRRLLEQYAEGRKVLNMFCYTGGFSVYALRGGAKEVHSVDSSERAIEITNGNVELNFPGCGNHYAYAEDAFKFLSNMDRSYDLIVLDPPAFAKHRGAIHNALKGYTRLNAMAFEKIKPGGLLFTFSCSQAVSKDQFRLAVFTAAAQSKRFVRILHQLHQPADHPVSIYHPEGEYLKGLVLYVE